MSDPAEQSVDTPVADSSPPPSPDAPDAPGGQDPESPTARAADAARAVEAPSRDLAEPKSAAGDPAAPDGDLGDGAGDGDQVTSPRLEHLQQTIDDAKEAAQRALGSTPEVDTSADA